MLTGAIVDTAELGKTVAASLVAGVGITALFSLMIFGAARAADMRREERGVAGAAFAGLTALAFLATAGGIAVGLVVMLAN